jgi:hypothetical protein
MKPILLAACLPLVCNLVVSGADTFTPGCTIPFNAIKTTGLDIDKQCGGSDEDAKKAESAAKNNFCVPGVPRAITYSTFTKLEGLSTDDIRRKVKEDRRVLTNLAGDIGEGTRVQFVAFLLDAHVSNGKKGELVNCTRPGEEFNDIHIELVKTATEDDACNSVTAEMSPHLRPEAWTSLPSLSIKRPVRVTGPLFFDGSHRPCHDDKRPSPNRISVWEIHPVYQFEVCKNKSLSACKVGNDAVWIPLDQWHSHSDEETDGND